MAKKREEVLEAGNEKTARTQEKTAKAATDVKQPFALPNVKVHVKPIVRAGRWLPEGHSGHEYAPW